jgi:CRISPR/Cas system CSM-associated protein Csm2 small subunit
MNKQILLDVGGATTAFYDSITIDKFMRVYYEKFATDEFDKNNVANLEVALKSVRVVIGYQKGQNYHGFWQSAR